MAEAHAERAPSAANGFDPMPSPIEIAAAGPNDRPRQTSSQGFPFFLCIGPRTDAPKIIGATASVARPCLVTDFIYFQGINRGNFIRCGTPTAHGNAHGHPLEKFVNIAGLVGLKHF